MLKKEQRSNMKKQFLRYKRIADQKVGRAEKTEVLNDELRQIEKHVEHTRAAYQVFFKKLQGCLHSTGHGQDTDKRLKRIPESHLGNSLLESGSQLDNGMPLDEPLSQSLKIGGQIFLDLANEQCMYEQFIEDSVINPYHQLVENELPSMLKLRERLKRLVLDNDNAVENVNRAQRAQYNATGVNLQQAKAKAETLQEECDQASVKLQQCKDQLITEMFEFLAKEADHSQKILDLHAKQLSYHQKCVQILQNSEHKLHATQDNARKRSAYRHPIEEHLQVTNREIAAPIEACVLMLQEYGIREEGIFRLAGSQTKLRKCRAILDCGKLDLTMFGAQEDIHAVAGALKQYLRDLPDPLLTFELHSQWLRASEIDNHDERMTEIFRLIECLPVANKANLRYLVKFLAVVASHEDVNKMSPKNLAVVMGPNILWSATDDISAQMRDSNLVVGVLESMITYSDYFFSGDIDFAVTPNATSFGNNQSNSGGDLTQASSPVPPSSSNISTKQQQSTSAAVAAVSTPAAPTALHTHSRKSSADSSMVLSASSDSLNNGMSTIERSKTRKHKSKAPPPPPQPNTAVASPQQQDTSKSRSRSHGGGSDHHESSSPRPPVAATRKASTRRPQAPPPQPPPSTALPSGEPQVPAPRAKPQVAPRRRQTINSASDEPQYPPPPLPDPAPTSFSSSSENFNSNNSNSGMISELQRQFNSRHRRQDSDSSDGQMTQF